MLADPAMSAGKDPSLLSQQGVIAGYSNEPIDVDVTRVSSGGRGNYGSMSAAAVNSVRLRIEYVELLFQSTQVREEHEKVEQQFLNAIETILSGIIFSQSNTRRPSWGC